MWLPQDSQTIGGLGFGVAHQSYLARCQVPDSYSEDSLRSDGILAVSGDGVGAGGSQGVTSQAVRARKL